jgi:hypothetical protein
MNSLRFFLGIALPVVCFLVSAAAWGQVAPHSGDLAFDAGYSYIGKGTNFNTTDINRYTLGFSGGVNLSQYIAVIGEYNYFSMPQVEAVNMDMMGYGGAVRFNLVSKGKVVPYGLFGGGGARLTASESGASVSSNGAYFGAGGGVSLFLGKNWGVRPEFRYNRFHYSFEGVTGDTNVLAATGGIFFQFGGTAQKTRAAR